MVSSRGRLDARSATNADASKGTPFERDITPAWRTIDWPSYLRDADIRGRRLRYVDIGSGPAILLVHGLGGSWQTWLENIPALSQNHRVIAVDLPGFGRSEQLPPPGAMSEHVNTLLVLLDRLQLGRVTLVGHSMGGLISLLLTEAFGSRVERLVLVSAGGVELGRVRLAMIVGSFGAFNALFSLRGVPQAFARRPKLRRALISPAVGDWRSLSPHLAREIIPPMRAPGFGLAVRAAAKVSSHVRPTKIACPVLLVWGSADRILPVSAARSLAADLPDSQLVVLDGVGHCAMFEAPMSFNSAVAQFLADVPVTVSSSAQDERSPSYAEYGPDRYDVAAPPNRQTGGKRWIRRTRSDRQMPTSGGRRMKLRQRLRRGGQSSHSGDRSPN